MDKISQMPEPILHYILNFLDSKEAARTAILSKNWRSIFNSRPVLSFIQGIFLENKPIHEKRETLVTQEPVFMDRIYNSLQKFLRQKISIHKFELELESYHPDRWDSHMNRWVHQLVNEAKVEELWLNVSEFKYVLPPIVFCSKTITSLRLRRCGLRNCNNVKLPNLHELSLQCVRLSQEMIESLISGCPSMEILELVGCEGLSEICVSSLDRLKKVDLRSCDDITKVEIIAPNLQVFSFWRDGEKHKKSCEIDLSECELTLKKLSLVCVGLTKYALKSYLLKFPRLEELTLSSLFLKSIEISNHQKLRKLEFFDCKNLGLVKIDAPDLQSLRYRNNELPFYWINCARLSKFEIDFHMDCGFDQLMLARCSDSFKECFMKFGHFKDMKLILEFCPDVIVIDDCEYLIEILCAIKCMERDMFVNVTFVSYDCIADYLFRSNMCHWKSVSLVSRHNNVNDFLKTLEMKKLKANCCKYKKCWRHYLYGFEKVTKPEEETPNLFKSCATMGYNITKIKLKWIPSF